MSKEPHEMTQVEYLHNLAERLRDIGAGMLKQLVTEAVRIEKNTSRFEET